MLEPLDARLRRHPLACSWRSISTCNATVARYLILASAQHELQHLRFHCSCTQLSLSLSLSASLFLCRLSLFLCQLSLRLSLSAPLSLCVSLCTSLSASLSASNSLALLLASTAASATISLFASASARFWPRLHYDTTVEDDPKGRDRLTEHIQALSNNPTNLIGANNRYDAEYIRYFTGEKIHFIPSFCGYTVTRYNPSRNSFLKAKKMVWSHIADYWNPRFDAQYRKC